MQVRRMLRATGVVVVAGLSYGTAAHADSVIVGTVVSAESKKPVSDVVVTATSPNLQGEQVVVTDAQGQYRIPQLPPGIYTLRFDKESFKPFSRAEVQLRLDRTIRVNVELLPESFTEVIEVTARPPTVDIGSTSQGVNVDQDFIKRIAVNRPGGKAGATRSFESLAELAPGAQNDAYGVSLNGTTSPENGYVVDGLSTNDPAFGINASPLSVEFVQDVNIITGGYMPEYGRSTGGVLNAVTKSGSNEFHGSVYGTVTPGFFEGRREQVRSAASVVTGRNTLEVMGDVGATLGGPILKDKLWFFAGVAPSYNRYTHTRALNRYETTVNDAGVATVVRDDRGIIKSSEIPGSASEHAVQGQSLQYMGKLTYLINQDHNVSVALAGTPSSSGGKGVLSIDPQTGLLPVTINGDPNSAAYGHIQELSNSTSVALKYGGAFADKKFLLDANVGWFHQAVSTLPSDGSRLGSTEGQAGLALVQYRVRRPIWYYEPNVPGIQALCDEGAAGTPSGTVACPTTGYYSGGAGQISDGALDRVQMNAKGTYMLQLLGNHVLKAGADVELLSYNLTKAYTGRVYLREEPIGSPLGTGVWQDYRRYGYQVGPDQAESEFFQQSSTRSTTVGGFIQDSWTIANRVTLNVGLRYDTQALYGADNSLAFVLGNQLSPRLGVIVDPLANGRMKVFANYARYYEQVPLNLLDRQFPGERRYVAYRNNGPGKCDPETIDTHEGQTACLVDPAGPEGNQEGNLYEVHSPSELNPSFTHAGGKVDRSPVDPNLQAQSSDELLFGAEYELLANVRLGASYTRRYMNSVIEDMSRDDGNTYFLGNPGEGFAKEFPKPVRNYDAVTVFLNRTFSDGWLAQASYTWSRLEGNYPGLFRPENSQLDPNILSDFDLVSLLKNRSGLLPYDRTHAVKVFGAKEFNFSNNLSASIGLSYRGNSGTPISVIGAHPTYGPSEAFIINRGSYGRTPWIHNIDSNIGVNYRISKTNVVSLSVDVFNLFNFQGVTAVDQTFTNQAVLPIEGGKAEGELTENPGQVTKVNGKPLAESERNLNFNNPTQYQTPRQIRLGLKYTF
ncbi:TonB-dependent receptor [Archangium sp.]|uniref:TonB-dependent receptor n=1 Tax=Archangium sp. TaxID=1872627 RepID=UPI002D726321|nr:TonB-dependent receptor [Archangium sp.]HYO59237.1 TonB-dependent receptor [Archangium sp.]